MMMKDPSCPENGVSEVVGALMLISVIVVGVAIMGVYLFSQPPPEKIPSLQASIWNNTQTLSISHDGGDPISINEIKIYVNCVDQTSKFNLSTAPTQPWTTWTNGMVLQYSTHSFPLGTVMVVYKGASSDVALTTFFVGDDASSCESGVFTPPPLPVTAGFTGTPTTGTKPLAVQFTDASTGPVTSWKWTFGDGGTSTAKSPLYTYPNAGIYSVSLTVSNGTGSNTQTRTNYITVSTPPDPVTAGFTGSPTSGDDPLVVQFTDASTGPVTSWKWEFGDGGTSEEKSPLYKYPLGTYSVSLTVSNTTGSDTLTRKEYITVFKPGQAPVTAGFTGDPTSGKKPLKVQFTDASTGSIISWKWDFGNGDTSEDKSPLYMYKDVGTYSVSLTVSNTTGSDTLTRKEYITVT